MINLSLQPTVIDNSNVPDSNPPQTVAAIDLGSTSFHLIVARIMNGQIHVVDRLREMVVLANGLDSKNRLDEITQKRALDCLARFGQRLRDMPPGSVRAVGTNTLRRAGDAADFLARAQAALGHPIEVIAGREEARLIYLGVAHSLPPQEGRRLVVDIGGGSTELIIGEGFAPINMESLHMGCVGMSRGYFSDGIIRARDMRRAEIIAELELQPIQQQFRHIGWQSAVGASGTIRAVDRIVRDKGWSNDGITRPALRKLRDVLIDTGHVQRLRLDGISSERAAVLPGGVAILNALMETLDIKSIRVADGALREGLLHDLQGRIQHEDVRETSIQTMMARYQVDAAQAARIEGTALACLSQVARDWGLNGEEHQYLLSWAARLHEIGLAIAHNQYHKHGAYVVENSDLPGFSRQEQMRLAGLIRGHRRKFPMQVFMQLPASQIDQEWRLCLLLRLAVLLHRSRTGDALPELRLTAGKKSLRIQFPGQWLDQHPLTEAELAREAEYLAEVNIKLEFS
ncbi:MAG: exopolyphosphatase [Gammaproteobacteria bacterium]|nr:exopolyphosphatase [Gammaproteobacteria bacterium]